MKKQYQTLIVLCKAIGLCYITKCIHKFQSTSMILDSCSYDTVIPVCLVFCSYFNLHKIHNSAYIYT